MVENIPIKHRELVHYKTSSGRVPFEKWINHLKDVKGQEAIINRIVRFEYGNAGKCEPVGEGVYELKIHFGPGYRVYFGEEGRRVIVLLCGGDKDSQKRDIERALNYWRDYRRRT